MPYFDLRYAALLVVNILKSTVSMPWEWDPFGIVTGGGEYFSWIKFWLFSALFFLFSFVSIEIPLTPQTDMGSYIRIHAKTYSVSLMLCFLASLFFPQYIFWYIYPIILLLAQCTACISSLWRSFVLGFQLVLPTIPRLNVLLITTTNSSSFNDGDDDKACASAAAAAAADDDDGEPSVSGPDGTYIHRVV